MKLKVIALPLVTGMLLSSVYLLPDAGDMSPAAINMELPAILDDWVLQKKPPTNEEINALAKDTTFSKATGLKAREGEFDLLTGNAIPDRLDLSIVLSGHNLNDSIHRPERCMPAQGHAISQSTLHHIKLSENRSIPVQRLLSVQSFPTDESQTSYTSFNCVTYYFFVGNRKITNGHYERTFIDMKDRLLLGMDQRWAYVSVSMWYGDLPWTKKSIPLDEADAKLKNFLSEFAEVQIDWEKIR